jgi:tetratricopeptide (TPR) repeat protein
MATGRLAFGGDTTAVMFDGILNRTPTPCARVNPGVPPHIEHVINKLLEKDRNRRYQTAADLEADLRALSQHQHPNQHPINAPKRSRAKLHFLAVFAATAAIAAAMLLNSDRTAPLTDRDIIVLADFQNETGDSVFDNTLKEALAIQLEQSPYLNILPEDRIRETLQFMARPPDEKVTDAVAREICQREGLKAVLGGSIVGLGSNYVLTLNAVNCATGESLAREQREAGSKEQVLATLGAAASSLRVKLGESLPSIQKTDVPTEDKVTTSSLEALRAYTEGMRLNSQGKYREAILFLEKAVALDARFVAAYSSLRVVSGNVGDGASARKYATKAYELRDTASEREKLRVTAAYELAVLGNIEKAVQTYDLYTRMYPKDYIGWNGLALGHRDLGRLEESLKEFQEVIRLRPMPLNIVTLSAAYLSLGRLEEARATIRTAIEQKRELNSMHNVLYDIAFIEGDVEAMRRELDWLKVPPAIRPPGTDLVFFGRLAEIRKRGGFNGLSRTELLYGYGAPAEMEARGELRRNRSVRAFAINAAMAGDIEGIRVLEESAKESPEDTILNLIDIPTAKAAFELRTGDAAKAIQELRPMSRFEPSLASLLGIYIRGQAYLKTKSAPEAAAEFQKIIDNRGVAPRFGLFVLSHLGLGRAYALGGDRVKARKSYDDFFALWKDADADIPILVEAKAEYTKLGS